MQDTTTGPTFIGVGAQKAGTGTIFNYLDLHQDTMMPPIKEFHFFDSGPNMRAVARAKKRFKLSGERMTFEQRAFLKSWARVAQTGSKNVEEYAELWPSLNQNVTGEITPAYSFLDEVQIAKIARAFPQTKVFMIIRDPIARLWSQLQMNGRGKKFRIESDEMSRGFIEEQVSRGAVKKRSIQSEGLARWQRHFEGRFHVSFFDDLVEKPEAFFAELFMFLALDSDPEKLSAPVGENFKAERKKFEKPDWFDGFGAEILGDEIIALSNALGGRANEWEIKYDLA